MIEVLAHDLLSAGLCGVAVFSQHIMGAGSSQASQRMLSTRAELL